MTRIFFNVQVVGRLIALVSVALCVGRHFGANWGCAAGLTLFLMMPTRWNP